MADKTTELNNKTLTVKTSEENEGLINEKEIEKALLHPFFISAIKNIYNTENEDGDLTGITDKSVNFNEKQGD